MNTNRFTKMDNKTSVWVIVGGGYLSLAIFASIFFPSATYEAPGIDYAESGNHKFAEMSKYHDVLVYNQTQAFLIDDT